MPNWLVKSYWTAFVLWHVRHEARLPYWPLEKVLGIQSRRVRSMVAHAYRNVPFYRDAMRNAGLRPEDFRTGEDLERLPLITKDDLASMPDRFRSRGGTVREGLKIQSSGTSGPPVNLTYDKAALFLALAHGHRARLTMATFVGRSIGYREAEIVRPNSVNLQMRQFYDSHSWTPAGIDLCRVRLSADAPFEEIRGTLNEFRPAVVMGYGSYLGVLFRWLGREGLPLHLPRLITYGGDRMPEADRAFIEQELKVPVWSMYQASEALRLAYQCELRQGFHISLDQVAIRVIDRHGNRVPPGEPGEIIVSNLTNRATVLLNFRLGDIVTLGKAACSCGRTLPTIECIEGRDDDVIVRPDGSVSHPLAFLYRIQAVPGVIQVQLIQEELRRFLLRVVCPSEADWAAALPQIKAASSHALGRDVDLRTERVDRIPVEPGGKVRAVVSRLRPH